MMIMYHQVQFLKRVQFLLVSQDARLRMDAFLQVQVHMLSTSTCAHVKQSMAGFLGVVHCACAIGAII